MRQLDPAYRADAAELSARVVQLEKKMDAMLAARQTVTLTTSPSEPTRGITQVSVSGDYQVVRGRGNAASGRGLHGLPLQQGERHPSGRTSIASCCLFGHSFSDRIKFWSELEVEHSLVEGGEETGEVALEQAYLDFLIKPWFNLRARHAADAGRHRQRAARTAVVQRRGAALCRDDDHSDHLAGTGLRRHGRSGPRLSLSRVPDVVARRQPLRCRRAASPEDAPPASMRPFRNPAKVARLEYAGVRRLTLGTSLYSGHAGFNTPGMNPRVTIAEFDGRYSLPPARFPRPVREYLGQPGRRTEPAHAAADRRQSERREPDARLLLGAGLHVLPRRSRNDVIVFARYEKYNTQQRMPPATCRCRSSTGLRG